MNKSVLSAAIIALSAFSSAQAAEPLKLAIGTKAGTQGVGFEIFAPVTQKFNARVSLNQFSYNLEQEIDGVDYSGDLDLNTISLNGDWHPFNGVFRLTAGAIINNNEISGTAASAENFTIAIGDNEYDTSKVRADALISFENIAPYLGFGFDKVSKTKKGGFGFSAEFGVMFQGTPELQFNVVDLNKGFDDEIKGALLDQLNGDIEKEINSISGDLESFDIWPVASMGLTYQF